MPMTGLTLLLGVSNSGKSQLILNLLKLHSKKFSAIFVFTGTKDVCADYQCLDQRIIHAVDENLAEKIELILSNAKRLKQQGKSTLLILDDCITTKFANNQLWDKIASMSRHSNICTLVSIQQQSKVSTVMKNNCVSLLITKLSKQNLNSLYEYSIGFDDKASFIDYVSKGQKGYIFILNRGDGYDSKPYGFYKYTIPAPKFKIELIPVSYILLEYILLLLFHFLYELL